MLHMERKFYRFINLDAIGWPVSKIYVMCWRIFYKKCGSAGIKVHFSAYLTTQSQNKHKFVILGKFWFGQMSFWDDLNNFQLLGKNGGCSRIKIYFCLIWRPIGKIKTDSWSWQKFGLNRRFIVKISVENISQLNVEKISSSTSWWPVSKKHTDLWYSEKILV